MIIFHLHLQTLKMQNQGAGKESVSWALSTHSHDTKWAQPMNNSPPLVLVIWPKCADLDDPPTPKREGYGGRGCKMKREGRGFLQRWWTRLPPDEGWDWVPVGYMGSGCS